LTSTDKGRKGLRRGTWRFVASACAGAVALVGAALPAGASTTRADASSSGGTITFGQLLPFTGTKAFLSSWAVHGDAAAVWDVNNHGGVMGEKLVAKSADDAGDAVDAVPALRKLLISHPAFIVGPYSLTIEAVIRDFGPNHVVDFMIGGTTQLDHMRYKYVFRTTASDSAEVVAMAYYAKEHGLTRAAFIFDNSANTQGLVPPLEAAYKKVGGTVLANVEYVPDQASYLSEITKAFSSHPDVVFFSADAQSATTLFTAARELGDLNVPWIGEDVVGSPVYAKAMGQPAASKYLYAVEGGAPTGPAYQHYLADYDAVWHTRQILSSSYNMYDSVIIASLAMTEARSTNPTVWVNDVIKVSNPPGIKCYWYSACVALIKAGKKINYEGATGPEDFNQYHNTFSGFTIDGFNASDQLVAKGVVTAQQVASLASS
jgi:ABC-type branched-subunit amino acid transport system substrate-binding protein